MILENVEIGKTYTVQLRGRLTEVVVIAKKPADQDVLWSTSQRDAVLLKLPSGRQIARVPSALTELKDQLDLFAERGESFSDEECQNEE
jgi:hypothetical protein